MDRRQHANVDLRITERGVCGGENDVARDSERHPAAARSAIDRRDGCLSELILRIEQSKIERMHERADLVRRSPGKIDDVQTGAETLGHRARDHDRAYGIVGGGAFERGNTPCTIARSSAFTGGRASVMRAMPPETL